MEKHVSYKVTFKETADEWLFQYRECDRVIHAFFNIKGKRVLKLLQAVQFPGTIDDMEKWSQYKKVVTIELVINDYSFETFWTKYNLKVKKEASQKVYDKLNLVEKIKCFNALKKYDEFLAKTGQAKAHLVTWLNQKRFNDEY